MSTGAKKRGAEPRRVAVRHERTRAEIIAIARHFLAKASLADFTLDDVADTLGVTKPAIYHYFPNRDALMRAAVAEGQLEHGRVLLKAAREADDGPAVLQALTTAFIDHYRDRLEIFRLEADAMNDDGRVRQQFPVFQLGELRTRRSGVARTAVAVANALGEVHKPRVDETRRHTATQ